jgi:UDP-N-acetylmuramoyl-L-alanyl-D-glutamate--2,6-diaminopimelate ligase
MIRPITSPSASLSRIAYLVGADFDQDLEINGISQSAEDCLPGDLFVAIGGKKFHGIEFIDQAIKNGAVAVLTDFAGTNSVLPTLIVENPRKVVGEIASFIFNEPSTNLFSVGITGTNGKTTITTLLHQIWQKANWDSGLIGTVNTQINSEVLPSIHTTPEAADLQGILAAMSERHCRAVAMEVSSHALEQYRVNGTHFNIAGFTNLTQDHLDFHGDMESYFKAKAKLFTFGRSDLAVINIDDFYGARLSQIIDLPVVKISRNRKADWHYEEIINFGATTQIKIRGRDGVLIEGETRLLGDFNLDNLLMAVAIAVISGVDPIEISANLVSYTGAAGRLEQVNVGQKFLAFVDYAHTPDAVENVLRSARAMTKGKVIAVLGCGGDRDRTKRPLMGKALTAADSPIFTSDNPRSEDPKSILQEMVGDLKHSGHVIADRKAAIEMAISLAKSGDVVAVLGKGHETGQEISGTKFPFDDRKVLAEAIAGVK